MNSDLSVSLFEVCAVVCFVSVSLAWPGMEQPCWNDMPSWAKTRYLYGPWKDIPYAEAWIHYEIQFFTAMVFEGLRLAECGVMVFVQPNDTLSLPCECNWSESYWWRPAGVQK